MITNWGWTLLSVTFLQSAFPSLIEPCNPQNGHELVNNCVGKDTIKLQRQVYQLCAVWEITEYNLTIFGNGSTINCTGNFGLKVNNSHLVHIQNVTFKNCGACHNTSSSDLNTNGATMLLKTAVYITRSREVSLMNITITESDGIGLSMFDCKDKIIINGSNFSYNKMGNGKPGGGGVYIQHRTPCMTSYSISHCQFIGNTAITYEDLPYHLQNPQNRSYSSFGKGGGLSINLLKANGVCIEVKHCSFHGNTAHRGGGMFILILSESKNNHIEILGSDFVSNDCITQVIPKSLISAGGAVSVLYRPSDNMSSDSMSNNTCLIQDSCFRGNTAFYGGALSVGTRKSLTSYGRVIIQDSQLINNTARVGSAVDLFCYWSDKPNSACMVEPILNNINVSDNAGSYTYDDGKTKGTTFSTIHLEGLTAHFAGTIKIHHNTASGVGMDEAIMMIESNSSVHIDSNVAMKGGGIAAIGSSQVILNPYTDLSITNNRAVHRGGGIYSGQTADTFSVYSDLCFIKYFDCVSRSVDPDDWNTNITFSNNSIAVGTNNIFASSIFPCVWPSATNRNVRADINHTFCNWTSWHFDICHKSIKTLPQTFSHETYSVEMYPSNGTKIKGFDVYDDLENTVTDDTTFASSVTGDLTIMSEVKGNTLTMKGKPGTYKLLVQTSDYRSVSAIVNVTIKECPVGYKLEYFRCTCAVNPSIIKVQCDTTNEQISLSLLIGHCIGYGSLSGRANETVFAKCPYTINNISLSKPFINNIQYTKMELNDQFCQKYKRKDFLCKECLTGKCINIFSPTYECIDCTKCTYFNWIEGIAAVIGPQTIFFVVVIIFHIGITSPSMNAYIFFSHVISHPLEILLIKAAWDLDDRTHHKGWLTGLAVNPYRLWTFDYPEILSIHLCISENFKIVHAIAFRYIHAFYPTVLIVVALVFIELHARNCKPVVYMWKPLCYICVRLRRNWEIKTSVIDAFATVVLLSYSKVINTSISLLNINYVYNISDPTSNLGTLLDYDTGTEFFKGEHRFFAIVAIVILLTFGSIPPLLLTFYPYRWFHKLLTLIRIGRWHGLYVFVETFQGSFKDGTNRTPDRRWFAGMYFIFRIIIFLEFSLVNEIDKLFPALAITYTIFLVFIALLRPYKKGYYNNLDVTFMAVLVLINCSICYIVSYTQQTQKLPRPTWHFTYVLLLLPTLYLLLYISYLLCTRSKLLKKHCTSRVTGIRNRTFRFLADKRRSHGTLFQDDTFSIIGEFVAPHSPLDNFSEVPDRINNPNRYYDLERSSKIASYDAVGIGGGSRVKPKNYSQITQNLRK